MSNIRIPTSFIGGTSYLLFCADADNEVFESNEDNNVVSRAISVIAPDLTVLSASCPSSVVYGETVNLSCNVKNIGNATASLTSLKFYISKKNYYDNTAILLNSIGLETLTSGETKSKSTTATIPDDFFGNTYILFYVDKDNSVKESNKSNNCRAESIFVELADLIVANPTCPTNAKAGTSIGVSCKVKNQGGASAAASIIKYYLVPPSSSLQAEDFSIKGGLSSVYLGSRSIGAISANGSADYHTTLLIPNTVIAGNYRIRYFVDANNVVEELDESNNNKYKSISVTERDKADLKVIDNIIITADENVNNYPAVRISENQLFQVEFSIENIGDGSTINSHEAAVYFSKNSSFNAVEDQLLGTFTEGKLQPNERDHLNDSYWSQSLDISVGSTTKCYIFVIADPDNIEKEESESNNKGSAPLYIIGGSSDENKEGSFEQNIMLVRDRQVTMELSRDEITTVTVYDISGRLVQKEVVDIFGVYELDMQLYDKGVYLINIASETRNVTKKIILE